MKKQKDGDHLPSIFDVPQAQLPIDVYNSFCNRMSAVLNDEDWDQFEPRKRHSYKEWSARHHAWIDHIDKKYPVPPLTTKEKK